MDLSTFAPLFPCLFLQWKSVSVGKMLTIIVIVNVFVVVNDILICPWSRSLVSVPGGTTRLTGCVLKAGGATDRGNERRASCQGRARNVYFINNTVDLGMVPNSEAPGLSCYKT